MRIRHIAGVVVALTTWAAITPATPALANTHSAAITMSDGRAHVIFDDTTRPATGPIHAGARVKPLLQTAYRPAPQPATRGVRPPDPEVLGFAEDGEISSGAWRKDFHFNLLSTIAYFGVNANADGSLDTGDSGYQTWVGSEMTALMQTAHANGVRVVLTVKCFDAGTIASITESETNRQTLIANVISQLRNRGGDGVNIDFEGFDPSVAAGFATFVAELHNALHQQTPQATYLTVDTYGSAATDTTMFDLRALKPYVDAFDVMAYDITPPGSPVTGPVAPLHGNQYSDANIVNDYLAVVPRSQIILGVPYYGYKWSTLALDPCCSPDGAATTYCCAQAEFYSSLSADFACAIGLNKYWNSSFATPWATWWSPSSGDPCGGDYGAWRELYYENADSLGLKYDLVNSNGLRGIGIWALGFDSGHNELWNEIAKKFSVIHGPMVAVTPMSKVQPTTHYTLSWNLNPGSLPAHSYSVFVRDGSGPWLHWADTGQNSITVFGLRGHKYSYYVEAAAANGASSGGPSGEGQAETSVAGNASFSLPFLAL